MAVLANTAEGGSNGVTPTSTDTGSGDAFSTVLVDATGVCTYTNVSRWHGNLAYRMACHDSTTGARVRLLWTDATAAASLFGRFYFMADDVSSTPLAQFRKAASTIVGYLSVFSSKMQIRHGAETVASTMTTTLTAGTWYRVEYNVVVNGTTTATIQVRLYAGDSGTLLEDSGAISVTAGAAISTWDTVVLGSANANTDFPSHTGYLYFDDPTYGQTTWPGVATANVSVAPPAATATGGSGTYTVDISVGADPAPATASMPVPAVGAVVNNSLTVPAAVAYATFVVPAVVLPIRTLDVESTDTLSISVETTDTLTMSPAHTLTP